MTAEQTYTEWRDAPMPEHPGLAAVQCWDLDEPTLDDLEDQFALADAEHNLRTAA